MDAFYLKREKKREKRDQRKKRKKGMLFCDFFEKSVQPVKSKIKIDLFLKHFFRPKIREIYIVEK